MIRHLYIPVLLALLVTPHLGGDPLWNAAVELFDRNRDLYARRIQTEATELDGRGNPRLQRQTEIEVNLAADGTARSRLVSLRDNGRPQTVEDVTTAASAVVTADGGAPSDDSRIAAMAVMQHSPFDPLLQNQLRLTRVDYGGPAAGAALAEYRYTLDTGALTISGTAWLSPADGTPLRLRATVAPLPRFVRELEVDQRFERSSAGWHASTATVRAEGGFLFVRRRVEIVMRFLDHVRGTEVRHEGSPR